MPPHHYLPILALPCKCHILPLPHLSTHLSLPLASVTPLPSLPYLRTPCSFLASETPLSSLHYLPTLALPVLMRLLPSPAYPSLPSPDSGTSLLSLHYVNTLAFPCWWHILPSHPIHACSLLPMTHNSSDWFTDLCPVVPGLHLQLLNIPSLVMKEFCLTLTFTPHMHLTSLSHSTLLSFHPHYPHFNCREYCNPLISPLPLLPSSYHFPLLPSSSPFPLLLLLLLRLLTWSQLPLSSFSSLILSISVAYFFYMFIYFHV